MFEHKISVVRARRISHINPLYGSPEIETTGECPSNSHSLRTDAHPWWPQDCFEHEVKKPKYAEVLDQRPQHGPWRYGQDATELGSTKGNRIGGRSHDLAQASANAPVERRPTSVARRETQASEARLRPSARTRGWAAPRHYGSPCVSQLSLSLSSSMIS